MKTHLPGLTQQDSASRTTPHRAAALRLPLASQDAQAALRKILRPAASTDSLRKTPQTDRTEAAADQRAEQMLRTPPPGNALLAPSHPAPPPLVLRSLDSPFYESQKPGTPLPDELRRFFEHGFEQSLGHVRIHTDPQSAKTAQHLHARAYAIGPHIVFEEGQYAPQTSEGLRLLAHELAHVAQGHSQALQRKEKAGSEPSQRLSKNSAEVREYFELCVRNVALDLIGGYRSDVLKKQQEFLSNYSDTKTHGKMALTLSEYQWASNNLTKIREVQNELKRLSSHFSSIAQGTTIIMASGISTDSDVEDLKNKIINPDPSNSFAPSLAGAPLQMIANLIQRSRSDALKLTLSREKDNEFEDIYHKLKDDILTTTDPSPNIQARLRGGKIFGAALRLRDWCDKKSAYYEVNAERFLEQYPALRALDSADVSDSEFDARKIGAAIKQSYIELIDEIDDNTEDIQDGTIHPFNLPAAIDIVRQCLASKFLREGLETVLQAHQREEFWVKMGMMSLLALLPVVGELVMAIGGAGVLAGQVIMGANAVGGFALSLKNIAVLRKQATLAKYIPILGVSDPAGVEWALAGLDMFVGAIGLHNIKSPFNTKAPPKGPIETGVYEYLEKKFQAGVKNITSSGKGDAGEFAQTLMVDQSINLNKIKGIGNIEAVDTINPQGIDQVKNYTIKNAESAFAEHMCQSKGSHLKGAKKILKHRESIGTSYPDEISAMTTPEGVANYIKEKAGFWVGSDVHPKLVKLVSDNLDKFPERYGFTESTVFSVEQKAAVLARIKSFGVPHAKIEIWIDEFKSIYGVRK